MMTEVYQIDFLLLQQLQVVSALLLKLTFIYVLHSLMSKVFLQIE